MCPNDVFLFSRDTSGQGRFSTIFRSYSRGAQGIILVYDITSKFSFNGLDRWISEIEQVILLQFKFVSLTIFKFNNQHAPGVPKILIGNRIHLAFRRLIDRKQANVYAKKHNMKLFEVSALCDHNIQESLKELSRQAIVRNGMYDIERAVPTLQDLCYLSIAQKVNRREEIDNLPLPSVVKSYLNSFTSTVESNQSFEKQIKDLKKKNKQRSLLRKISNVFKFRQKIGESSNQSLSRVFSFNFTRKSNLRRHTTFT